MVSQCGKTKILVSLEKKSWKHFTVDFTKFFQAVESWFSQLSKCIVFLRFHEIFSEIGANLHFHEKFQIIYFKQKYFVKLQVNEPCCNIIFSLLQYLASDKLIFVQNDDKNQKIVRE